ncbi:hypothetical protein J8L98_17590 [Pseudoalteromonas sp. MMG013]|uniref:Uncharacterized protein n=1 Tax=Pseudoalteromonas aurantia 208 TaxID=1314867 RepID=A0ABR9EHA2_9GAMM|nr:MULTISPECIES: hypothetical protein [Pseudoalteromonas]MBE0370336.1 hypothetical protein [Pseudoalteromonas aurantia 208]MBQ4845302.1 hypothetical protein [Pseudoalteromonas sp. MMG005]MBQ4863498.1 hypothetical protein [Pseudoalteromonas sp. MMG013]
MKPKPNSEITRIQLGPTAKEKNQTTKKRMHRPRLPQDIVMVIVGKWAMPTTVVLVLITCLSGYYLDVEAFTPVVGMIAPVIMALIMVIREASVGKDEDQALADRKRERDERIKQYQIEKELKLAQMALEEKRHTQELDEKARQFDLSQAAAKDVVELAREMNSSLVDIMKKESD